MNKKYALLIAILVAIIAFIVGYDLPRSQTYSLPTGSPSGSVNIPVSIVSLKENASSSPSIHIEYPQFGSLAADFNASISSAVTDRLAQFRKDIAENDAARKATGGSADSIPASAYSFMATWQVAQINQDYVSFIIRFDSYAGGANENEEMQTFNYSVTGNKVLSLQDLFPNDSNYLNEISTQAQSQLTETFKQNSPDYQPDAMLSAGTEPTTDNFSNFTFDDYNVTIYFPKYAVAPGSFGEQKAVIPRGSTNL